MVFCADKRVESDTGSAEIEEKIRWISDRWYVLAAGPLDETQELIEIYRAHLKQASIDTGSVLEELRIPPRILRRRMAEALIHQRVALSYEEFLEVGKDQLQEEVYRQLAYDVTQQRIDAELLLVGYVPRVDTKKVSNFEAYLCRSGDIFSRRHFAAIGSGELLSQSQRSIKGNRTRPRLYRTHSIAFMKRRGLVRTSLVSEKKHGWPCGVLMIMSILIDLNSTGMNWTSVP